MKEKFVRWFIRKYLPDMHLAYNPGKHPETRRVLNKSVSKVLDEMEARAIAQTLREMEVEYGKK